jgi:hypothetical protein
MCVREWGAVCLVIVWLGLSKRFKAISDFIRWTKGTRSEETMV